MIPLLDKTPLYKVNDDHFENDSSDSTSCSFCVQTVRGLVQFPSHPERSDRHGAASPIGSQGQSAMARWLDSSDIGDDEKRRDAWISGTRAGGTSFSWDVLRKHFWTQHDMMDPILCASLPSLVQFDHLKG